MFIANWSAFHYLRLSASSYVECAMMQSSFATQLSSQKLTLEIIFYSALFESFERSSLLVTQLCVTP